MNLKEEEMIEEKMTTRVQYPSDLTEQEITREIDFLIRLRKEAIKERQQEKRKEKKPEKKKIEKKDPAEWTEKDIESEWTYEKKRIGKETVHYRDERKKWKVIDGQRVLTFETKGRRVCINYIIRSVERHDESEKSKKYFCGNVEYGAAIFQKESQKDVYRKQEQYHTAKTRVNRFSIFRHYVWTDLDDLEDILRETMKTHGCQLRHPLQMQQQQDVVSQ